MNTQPLHTAQEHERAEWRRATVRKLANGTLITDELAVLLDALYATPQSVAANPVTPHCVDHFNAHAEAVVVKPFTARTVRPLLDDLARLELLPPWCSWPQPPAPVEGVAL